MQFDLTGQLGFGVERIQIALRAFDAADIFSLPGTAATPSPVFDDVAFYKYRIGGPVLSTTTASLAQDGFPVSGSIDASSPAARDALDVPFDMARDVSTGSLFNVPGDSVAFDAMARIPGTVIDAVRMVWALQTSPVFEDALRAAPARLKDENVTAGAAGSVWTGEVVAVQTTISSGVPLDDRYFVDLPDQDFLYPGDVLHYYFQATDDDGRITTLPADTSGFGDFGATSSYERSFTVRALPSLKDTGGSQPEVLVVNDFGRGPDEDGLIAAFGEFDYVDGVDFDSYTVQGATSFLSNGIGSAGAHGATVGQLAGYHQLLYFAGGHSVGLLSNGDGLNGDDKSDDIALLEQWHALPDVRNGAYFGDYIASGNLGSPEGVAFVEGVLGVDPLGHGLDAALGGTVSPQIEPSNYGTVWLDTAYMAFGGCPGQRSFDLIRPGAASAAGHQFLDAQGQPLNGPGDPVPSVIHSTTTGIRVTFPYSLAAVIESEPLPSASAQAWLLTEVLRRLFAHDQGACTGTGSWPWCTDAPQLVAPARLSITPNPFNPATTVEFTAAPGSRGSVRVYNLRGELVRTLHSGTFTTRQFPWDGTDERGTRVGSGVYLVRAEDGQVEQTQKVALVT